MQRGEISERRSCEGFGSSFLSSGGKISRKDAKKTDGIMIIAVELINLRPAKPLYWNCRVGAHQSSDEIGYVGLLCVWCLCTVLGYAGCHNTPTTGRKSG